MPIWCGRLKMPSVSKHVGSGFFLLISYIITLPWYNWNTVAMAYNNNKQTNTHSTKRLELYCCKYKSLPKQRSCCSSAAKFYCTQHIGLERPVRKSRKRSYDDKDLRTRLPAEEQDSEDDLEYGEPGTAECTMHGYARRLTALFLSNVLCASGCLYVHAFIFRVERSPRFRGF